MNFSSRTGTWLAAAFTASLAINVFLAGLFVGQRVTAPPPPLPSSVRGPDRPGDRPMPAVVDRIAEALSPKDRETFLATIDKHRPTLMAAGTAVREARGKVRELLAADNFDRGATDTAMGELRNRQQAFQHELQMAMLDAAQALPPEARRQMINLGGRRPPPRE